MHDIFCRLGFRKRARVLDLSVGGCRLELPRRRGSAFTQGQPIITVLDAPEGQLALEGRVAWVTGAPRGGELVGIQFVGIDEPKRLTLHMLAMAHKEALTIA